MRYLALLLLRFSIFLTNNGHVDSFNDVMDDVTRALIKAYKLDFVNVNVIVDNHVITNVAGKDEEVKTNINTIIKAMKAATKKHVIY